MSQNNNKNSQAINTITKALTNIANKQQTQQIHTVNNKIRKIEKFMKNIKLLRDPMEFMRKNPNEVVARLNDYRTRTRSQYLYSMIHPDYAVTDGVQVKMYSDVPVPTSSIGVRMMYQIRTSQVGTFLLSWSPNFLATNQDIEARFGEMPTPGSSAYSTIIVCTDNNMTRTIASEANSQFQFPCFIPSVMLQKYRLVSAIMKVRLLPLITKLL